MRTRTLPRTSGNIAGRKGPHREYARRLVALEAEIATLEKESAALKMQAAQAERRAPWYARPGVAGSAGLAALAAGVAVYVISHNYHRAVQVVLYAATPALAWTVWTQARQPGWAEWPAHQELVEKLAILYHEHDEILAKVAGPDAAGPEPIDEHPEVK